MIDFEKELQSFQPGADVNADTADTEQIRSIVGDWYLKNAGDTDLYAYCQQAVNKYNLALHCAQEDSCDLAMLHIKPVVEKYPQYRDAVKLMALLCIRDKDYAKGYRTLTPLMQSSASDPQTIRYMDEIRQSGGKNLQKDVKRQIEQEEKGRQYAIVPTYNQKNELLHDFFCIIGGIILGVLACIFLILPSERQKLIEENNRQLMTYGDNLSDREVEILSLESSVEGLEEELKKATDELNKYEGTNGTLSSYTELLNALSYFVQENYLEASKAFTAINYDAASKDEAYKKVYNMVSERLQNQVLVYLHDEGLNLYKKYRYEEAVEYFKECLRLRKDYVDVYYWLGLCYYNSGDTANAEKYFFKLQKNYPETQYARYAKNLMPYKEPTETTQASENR